MNTMKKTDKKPSNLKRFISYYKPHLGLFVLDMCCALFISSVDIVYPLISKTILNEYLAPENPHDRIIYCYLLWA